MQIKTSGSLGKIRVGRETGNTHIFFGIMVIQITKSNMKNHSRGLDRYNVLRDNWTSLDCQTTLPKTSSKIESLIEARHEKVLAYPNE